MQAASSTFVGTRHHGLLFRSALQDKGPTRAGVQAGELALYVVQVMGCQSGLEVWQAGSPAKSFGVLEGLSQRATRNYGVGACREEKGRSK